MSQEQIVDLLNQQITLQDKILETLNERFELWSSIMARLKTDMAAATQRREMATNSYQALLGYPSSDYDDSGAEKFIATRVIQEKEDAETAIRRLSEEKEMATEDLSRIEQSITETKKDIQGLNEALQSPEKQVLSTQKTALAKLTDIEHYYRLQGQLDHFVLSKALIVPVYLELKAKSDDLLEKISSSEMSPVAISLSSPGRNRYAQFTGEQAHVPPLAGKNQDSNHNDDHTHLERVAKL